MSLPFHETLDLTLIGKIGRVHRLCRAAVTSAVEPLGLTQSRWTVMVHLSSSGEGATAQHLAERLGIEMPSLSRTLKQLEQADIIERRVDESDKRSRKLYFTAKGKTLLEELKSIIAEAKQSLYKGLDDEQLDSTARVLLTLESNALKLSHALSTKEDV